MTKHVTHRCSKCKRSIIWADKGGKKFALDPKPTKLYAIVGDSGTAQAHQVSGYGHAPHRCGTEGES